MLWVQKITAVVSILLLAPRFAIAEYVEQQLLCVDGGTSRIIELLQSDQTSALPCTIRENKLGQPSTILWRAEYQANFCSDQIKRYREKLQTAGMQCEWLSTDSVVPIAADSESRQQLNATTPATTSEVEFVEAVSWTTSVASGFRSDDKAITTGTIPSGIRAIELPYIHTNRLNSNLEGGTAGVPLPDAIPEPPNRSSDTTGDENSLDNWVIFLSAKTLASIKTLLIHEPSVFTDYLAYEQRNTQSIYSKLQLRIQHLAEIADAQNHTFSRREQ